MSETIWVTRYALTEGIREFKIATRSATWPALIGGMALCRGDVHYSPEAAQARVKEMAGKSLASLDRKRAKLEKIARDGANVVEEK